MSALEKIETTELMPMRTPAQMTAITPMAMLSQAVANGAGIEVLERLMSLSERWEANQARKAFDDAMSDAKAEIGPIAKNRHVGFDSKNGGARTDYRHEDLAEIARTVDPILAKHGLSYRFQTVQEEGRIKVTCIVAHRDGHSETNSLMANSDTSGNKNSIQAIGSTITYLQRYTLKAALGLAASNDDDGRSAVPSEGVALISEEQYIQIADRMKALHVTLEQFCNIFQIDSVADLPASRFNEAMQKFDRREQLIAKAREAQPK